MSNHWKKLFALGFTLLLGTVGTVSAQTATGNVFVIASDGEGEALQGVTVTLSGAGAPRVVVTNDQGQARFLSIDPGSVQLEAALDGFSSIQYPSVSVRVGLNTTIEFTLSGADPEGRHAQGCP